jgi:hypothetical protein
MQQVSRGLKKVGKKGFAGGVYFRLLFCKPHRKRKGRSTHKGIFDRSRDGKDDWGRAGEHVVCHHSTASTDRQCMLCWQLHGLV